MHGVVEHLGRPQVGPERLLHDDPGPLDQAGLVQALDHRPGGRRGDAQVVEAPALPSEHPLGPGHRFGQGGRPVGLGHEVDPRPEGVPVRVHDVPPGELPAGGEGEVVELRLVDLLEGGADDVAPRGAARRGRAGADRGGACGGPGRRWLRTGRSHGAAGSPGRRRESLAVQRGDRSVMMIPVIGDCAHHGPLSGTPLSNPLLRTLPTACFRSVSGVKVACERSAGTCRQGRRSAIISDTSWTVGESITSGRLQPTGHQPGPADPDIADLDGRGESPFRPGQAEQGMDGDFRSPRRRAHRRPARSRPGRARSSTDWRAVPPAHVELHRAQVLDRPRPLGVDEALVALGVDDEDAGRRDGDAA